MEPIKVKFALYQNISYPSSEPRCHVYDGPDWFPESDDDYVRVSDYAEIEMTPRDASEQAIDLMTHLIKQRDNIEVQLCERLDDIDRRIEELRALPAPPTDDQQQVA